MAEDDLKKKVGEWLDGEGYPLEFRTAHEFHAAGFNVLQGEYVDGKDDAPPRELDVAAYKMRYKKNSMLRVYHVVECKWTKDKPWVVFSSERSVAASACVAQTIGSLLGHSILWAVAGDSEVQKASLFASPKRAGFNGRQAMAKGNNDVFYNALRSVTTLSTLLVQGYDDRRKQGVMPQCGVVAFPVIVIEGRLFEAWFDRASGQVQLEECQHVRLHWRGSPSWSFRSTVDILVADYLPQFARDRALEVDSLLDAMVRGRDQIAGCFEARSLDLLEVITAPRGVVGLPPLLLEIRQMQNQLTENPPEASS